MTHIDQHAAELRGTLFVWHILQGDKQFFQILLVGGVHAWNSGRVNARSTAQKINRQTESSAIAAGR